MSSVASPPRAASVPSHPHSTSLVSPPSHNTPPQSSVATFVTPATTSFQSTSSPNAGASKAGGGALANLFSYQDPSPPSNTSSSTTSVDASPLTATGSDPSFAGNPAGASTGTPVRSSSTAPLLPVGPGGFGRHRELVYSRPTSRPSSAQSWNDERVPQEEESEGGEWQATVRGASGASVQGGGLAIPKSSSHAGGLVVHAPAGTPSSKVRSRPHSFHAGMETARPEFQASLPADRDATIRGGSSSFPISDYLDDPTLFDGALPTATPGLVASGASGGSDGSGGAQQQAYYHQMQVQQQRIQSSSSSDRPRQAPQAQLYPPPPPQHRSVSYSHPQQHAPPQAPYYPEPRGLRHSQPNIHSSPYSDAHHYPSHPRPDSRTDPRAAYAQQQQQQHHAHQSFQSPSSYPQQMPSRSGGPPGHHRPSLPFPINSPSPSSHATMQQRSHSMHSLPHASNRSLDPSSLQNGPSYRTHPDGSDWSTSSAGEGDSAGEYSYSSTSASGAEGEEEMKDLDEQDEDLAAMRVYQGPGSSSFVGGAIGGGPEGLMRMHGADYSDEEDDHAIDPRDPAYANATRYRGSGPSRYKRESLSSSQHFGGHPPSSRQYYNGPAPGHHSSSSSYPYGSSLPTYLNSSPPPQPMYPISAYGLVAPQEGYQGYSPAPMHHHQGPQRKPRLIKTSKIPAPIPVPHLNKRSRGRHVPIDPKVVRSKKGGNGRVYECMVTECGKCFGRSEHLKRHIRSLHTNEKPFPCPHPTCTKEFSRHDNLNQHFRIHLASPTDQAAMEGLDMAGLGIVGTRFGPEHGEIDSFGRASGSVLMREQSV